jgi:hypothetical protein
MAVTGAALAAKLGNDISSGFSAPATAPAIIIEPTNGVDVAILTICNTGAYPLICWGGNLTNISFSGSGPGMQTNIDATVTNASRAGYVLAPTNGVLAIILDTASDYARTWYGRGVGGTALGTVNRTPRLP